MKELRFLLFNLLIHLPVFLFAQIAPYPDNSPPLDNFLQMGVPPTDENWDLEDYNKTFYILDQIYEADKFSLPRQESSYSGKLFDRMLAIENFNFLIDRSVNIGKRVLAFENYKELPFRMLVYYVEDHEIEERFSAEVLECYFLEAFVYHLGFQMYTELKDQLGDRANLGNFQSGYEALELAYFQRINNLCHILEEDFDRYEKRALQTFTNKLFFFLPKINNESYLKQLRLRLRLIEKDHPNASLRQIIQELRQQL